MVNMFFILFFGLFSCSACDEEIKFTDIVSFIQDLNPELIETKNSILQLMQVIPSNIWFDTSLKELISLKSVKALYFKLFKEGKLNQHVQECIMSSTQEALDNKMFMDDEFNEQCDHGKYLEALESHLASLTLQESPANDIASDFLNMNMWCSNNGDLPSCYAQAHTNIIKKAATIASVIDVVNDALPKIIEDYDRTSEECMVGAVAKLISIESFIKDTLYTCLD